MPQGMELPNLPELHTARAEFTEIRQWDWFYVDKTAFLHTLLPLPAFRGNPVTPGDYHLLTRPRRFGKTLLVSTLEAWFQGRPAVVRGSVDLTTGKPAARPALAASDLFRGLAIQQWREPGPFRPVIRLNMARRKGPTVGKLQTTLRGLLSDTLTTWYQRGVDVPYAEQARNGRIVLPADGADISDCLYQLIGCLHGTYGIRPVVLIDEYDAPLTQLLGRPATETDPILAEMCRFYQTLKDAEADLHYVFLTGIARFGHTNLFSALNNLSDISWERRYATLCGFTQSEVQRDLAPHLARLQEAWPEDRNVGFLLYQQYNGYRFSLQDDTPTVCNPFTLTRCLQTLLDNPDVCPSCRPCATSAPP